MKCKYCGAEIANDSVYCEQCGKFTNPFNKKGVTCSMSLVKWLLFGTMVISMVYSYLTSHSYYSHPYYWSWIPLLIPLAIFVVSLVLSIKKKISWVFTVFTFLFFSAAIGAFIIKAGILLLYIIYEIVAASIARKRIRQS